MSFSFLSNGKSNIRYVPYAFYLQHYFISFLTWSSDASAGTVIWQLGQPAYWAVSGITLFTVVCLLFYILMTLFKVPFTMAVMAPLANNRLFELNRNFTQQQSTSVCNHFCKYWYSKSRSAAEDEASILLDLWDSLHWIRSVISVTAFGLLASKLLKNSV